MRCFRMRCFNSFELLRFGLRCSQRLSCLIAPFSVPIVRHSLELRFQAFLRLRLRFLRRFCYGFILPVHSALNFLVHALRASRRAALFALVRPHFKERESFQHPVRRRKRARPGIRRERVFRGKEPRPADIHRVNCELCSFRPGRIAVSFKPAELPRAFAGIGNLLCTNAFP